MGLYSSKEFEESYFGIKAMKLTLNDTDIFSEFLDSFITLKKSTFINSKKPMKNSMGYPFGLGIYPFESYA
jgi:hypothetical protein